MSSSLQGYSIGPSVIGRLGTRQEDTRRGSSINRTEQGLGKQGDPGTKANSSHSSVRQTWLTTHYILGTVLGTSYTLPYSILLGTWIRFYY